MSFFDIGKYKNLISKFKKGKNKYDKLRNKYDKLRNKYEQLRIQYYNNKKYIGRGEGEEEGEEEKLFFKEETIDDVKKELEIKEKKINELHLINMNSKTDISLENLEKLKDLELLNLSYNKRFKNAHNDQLPSNIKLNNVPKLSKVYISNYTKKEQDLDLGNIILPEVGEKLSVLDVSGYNININHIIGLKNLEQLFITNLNYEEDIKNLDQEKILFKNTLKVLDLYKSNQKTFDYFNTLYLNNLESLYITLPRPSMLTDTLNPFSCGISEEKFRNLEKIYIDYDSSSRSTKLDLSILNNIEKNLKELCIYNSNIDNYEILLNPDKLKNLEILDISQSVFFKADEMIEKQEKKLDEMIEKQEKKLDEIILDLSTKYKLKKLILYIGYKNGKDIGGRILKIKIPNSLETLDIDSGYQYTIENLTEGEIYKFKRIRLIIDQMEKKKPGTIETQIDYLLNTLKTNFIKEGELENPENYYNLDLEISHELKQKIDNSNKIEKEFNYNDDKFKISLHSNAYAINFKEMKRLNTLEFVIKSTYKKEYNAFIKDFLGNLPSNDSSLTNKRKR